jgi:hypothetical protein
MLAATTTSRSSNASQKRYVRKMDEQQPRSSKTPFQYASFADGAWYCESLLATLSRSGAIHAWLFTMVPRFARFVRGGYCTICTNAHSRAHTRRIRICEAKWPIIQPRVSVATVSWCELLILDVGQETPRAAGTTSFAPHDPTSQFTALFP